MKQKSVRHSQRLYRRGLSKGRIFLSQPRLAPIICLTIMFSALIWHIRVVMMVLSGLFVCFSQLWNSDHAHVLEACKDSLNKLRLDYLDLYLVHFPIATKHTGERSFSVANCVPFPTSGNIRFSLFNFKNILLILIPLQELVQPQVP